MAHRSREPGRLQRRKLTVPRDRGEKYTGPSRETDDEPSSAPPGSRGTARKGQAHELLMQISSGRPSESSARRRSVRPLAWLALGVVGVLLALGRRRSA